MVEREWQVHECLFCETLPATVVLLDHIVDLADRRAHKKRHGECGDVPMADPEPDECRVENAK